MQVFFPKTPRGKDVVELPPHPGLFVFGEPTHDRDDLSPAQRALPDRSRVEALIVPAGCGIMLKVVPCPGRRHDPIDPICRVTYLGNL